MLVGIVGFIGSGKGTVGELFAESGFITDSFARPLKDAVSIIFEWPRKLLEGDTELSRKWREEPDAFWSEKFGRPFTPREALQLMGTESCRDVFHNDIWVISLINRSKGKNVVVTDVRFQNEIKYIQDNGGIVIRVKRGEDPWWYDTVASTNYLSDDIIDSLPHRSEWDWVGCDFDYTITNDGTLQELREKVETILQSIK